MRHIKMWVHTLDTWQRNMLMPSSNKFCHLFLNFVWFFSKANADADHFHPLSIKAGSLMENIFIFKFVLASFLTKQRYQIVKYFLLSDLFRQSSVSYVNLSFISMNLMNSSKLNEWFLPSQKQSDYVFVMAFRFSDFFLALSNIWVWPAGSTI